MTRSFDAEFITRPEAERTRRDCCEPASCDLTWRGARFLLGFCTVIRIRKGAHAFLGLGLDNKVAFLFFFFCTFSCIM